VAVVVLVIIAWYPPSTLYRIFVLKFELLIQAAPALILGLYWLGLNRRAVFAGMLAGALLASTFTLLGWQPLGLFNGLWGLLLNMVICVGGSLIIGVSAEERRLAKDVIAMD